MDLMLGHSYQDQPTNSELGDKLDLLELKLDRIKQEITVVGIAVLGVAAMIYFKWP